jgi:hypothetical protein
MLFSVESAVITAYDGTFAPSGPGYFGKRFAVVVPAYNEEELIGETIDSIPDRVINDSSKGRTGEIPPGWDPGILFTMSENIAMFFQALFVYWAISSVILDIWVQCIFFDLQANARAGH